MTKTTTLGRPANRRRGRLLAIGFALALCANAEAPPTPADHYADLFAAVQEQRLFDDGKAFADAVPKRDPDMIMAQYRAQKPATPADLRRFVLANFSVPGVPEPSTASLRQHVRSLWPHLVREDTGRTANGSLIVLDRPYVVPGGRFRELYYWDSYFTMLGLAADGRDDLVESMIDDFTSLIERFGHIPNGTRSYYLSRSQPPFYALMLDLSKQTDGAIRARRLAALRQEHEYWMAGESCASVAQPCQRVVRMPDGSLLNRYWDDRDTPRDESFAEDRATAAKAANRPAPQVYRDLRAGAESGWDFSSRWLADPNDLATLRTTRVVPVDLNALLWTMEKRIEKGCRAAGDRVCTTQFAGYAARRKAAFDRYLWTPRETRFADWLVDDKRASPVLSSATLYPLFVGMASPAQATAVAKTTKAELLAPGGLRTTALRTGQQWDAPNGWAPLQWVAIEGLARYGKTSLSADVAGRWIGTVRLTYRDTGKMLEKYNVEERLPGGGGEYPLQDGFGWTNGVTAALLARYPSLDEAGKP
jgi:alpha,alpha-trehalase